MAHKMKRTIIHHIQPAGYGRWFRTFVALLFIVSICAPAFNWIDGLKAYAISPDAEKVIGEANKNLSAKFSYDQAARKWQFNKNGIASLAQNFAKQNNEDPEGIAGALTQLMAKQVGGGSENDQSLYSVDLPSNAKEGITYFDNVTKLSFKMIPTFSTREGKLIQDRVVYPFSKGGQIVYTAKTNGLKEDIVLSKYIGETLRYGYTLELPDTLEARLLNNGSIGVYSANPALFGNLDLSNVTPEDRAKILQARTNGNKEHLIFGIPAPFIKDQNGQAGATYYELDGNKLTVVASGLNNLSYPLTIDPSVTISSSSEFAVGNNEGMIEFGTDQINRGGLTGGTIGSWASAGPSLASKLYDLQSVVMNGKVYLYGGRTWNTASNAIYYSTIGSNGSLGAWQQTTTGIPTGSFNYYNRLVAYNGYIYEFGGKDNAGNITNSQYMVKPDSNGNITQAWTSLGTPPWGARYGVGATAYNGYMYLTGGCTHPKNSVPLNCDVTAMDTWSAPINANGTLGTWTQVSTGTYTSLRWGQELVAYNGWLYMINGCISNSAGGILATYNCDNFAGEVFRAKIGTNGNIGSWISSGSLLTARLGPAMAYNGYLYAIQGCIGQNCASTPAGTIEYALIRADGSLGSWQSSPISTGDGSVTSRLKQASFIYNGYVYQVGGCIGTQPALCTGADGNNIETSISAEIDPPGGTPATVNNGGTGAINAFSSTQTITARAQGVTISHRGYMYVTGGCVALGATMNSCNTATNGVQFTKVAMAGNGTVDGYTSFGTGFSNNRFGHAAAAYNGYLYIIGGCTSAGAFCSATPSSDIQFVDLNDVNKTTGAVTGTGWRTATGPARYGASATVYNGYLYLVGGCSTANCSTIDNTVQRAQINPGGSLGSWSSTGVALSNPRFYGNAVAYAGKLYVMGGCAAVSAGSCTSFLNDIQYATINPDGSLSNTWNSVGNFGTARYGASLSATNGMFYLTGGCSANSSGDCTGLIATVRSAYVNSDGTLGAWGNQANSLGAARFLHGSAVLDGFLYITGGKGSAAGLLNDTQYTGMQLIARKGIYSVLTTVPATVDITGVYFNGTVGPDTILTYRTAPATTAIFGGVAVGTQGNGSEPTPACGVGEIYYVMATLTLDDSLNATFGETGQSNVTDISIYYRSGATPPPNKRLNGGKWFNGEIQQPLDTCKQYPS